VFYLRQRAIDGTHGKEKYDFSSHSEGMLKRQSFGVFILIISFLGSSVSLAELASKNEEKLHRDVVRLFRV
jgi:hypothetical protein